ncbi:MAG: DNA polymerase III subunit psi [Chitinophagaceae bacterium]|nr:DNA polymerase III subunit psi [Chitinophagaceae bacterium]MCB9046710.1 DNA polymerase III subunit psi [Chitinophagales bacterium]
MTDFPRILNTEIIDTEIDIFWQNDHIAMPDMSPRKVLIVTTQHNENSAEQAQLNKIINACKLTAEQYNIIQVATGKQVAWHQIKNTIQPENVLLFGVHPNQLGVSALFRLNSINHFDGAKWIPTLSLQELEQQPQAKKDLWSNALKPIFADQQ